MRSRLTRNTPKAKKSNGILVYGSHTGTGRTKSEHFLGDHSQCAYNLGIPPPIAALLRQPLVYIAREISHLSRSPQTGT